MEAPQSRSRKIFSGATAAAGRTFRTMKGPIIAIIVGFGFAILICVGCPIYSIVTGTPEATYIFNFGMAQLFSAINSAAPTPQFASELAHDMTAGQRQIAGAFACTLFVSFGVGILGVLWAGFRWDRMRDDQDSHSIANRF